MTEDIRQCVRMRVDREADFGVVYCARHGVVTVPGMELSFDARELLRLVAQAPRPVAVFDFFPVINPRAPGMDDLDSACEAWIERQLDLSDAHLLLLERGLIRVVRRAEDMRHDLVEATLRGRAALTQTLMSAGCGE